MEPFVDFQPDFPAETRLACQVQRQVHAKSPRLGQGIYQP